MGLFVALFTFISIEFSLFKELTSFSQAVSLTLLIGGLLLLFILALHLIIRATNTNKNYFWIIACIVLLGISISLIFFGINSQGYFKKWDYPLKPPSVATPSATLMPKPVK